MCHWPGESEANVDLTLYANKADAHMALTERGWEQARATGRLLRAECGEDVGVQARACVCGRGRACEPHCA